MTISESMALDRLQEGNRRFEADVRGRDAITNRERRDELVDFFDGVPAGA